MATPNNQMEPGDQQVEKANNIFMNIDGQAYPIKEVDATTTLNVEFVWANQLEALGWGVSQVEHSGTIAFHGNIARQVRDVLTKEDGLTPEEGHVLVIQHMDGSTDGWKHVFLDEIEYGASENDFAERTYSWVAMAKGTDVNTA